MWFVVCDEYRSGPFRTTAEAERRLAQVVAAGNCTAEHRVEAEAPCAASPSPHQPGP